MKIYIWRWASLSASAGCFNDIRVPPRLCYPCFGVSLATAHGARGKAGVSRVRALYQMLRRVSEKAGSMRGGASVFRGVAGFCDVSLPRWRNPYC